MRDTSSDGWTPDVDVSLINHFPGILAYMDVQLVYRYVSDAFCALFQRDRSSVVGKRLVEVWGPSVEATYGDILRHVIATGKPVMHYGLPLAIPRDGAERVSYWDYTFAPHAGPRGELLGLYVVAFEVTERIRLERQTAEQAQAVQQSEQRLNEAQHLARVGNWEWDMAANVVTWSDEMYRLSGVPPGTPLTYERIIACVHPLDRDLHNQMVDAGIREHKPWIFDYRAVHPDGTVLVLEARGYATYDAAGRAVTCIGTSQDVTARRAMEAQSVRRTEALEAANAQYRQLDAVKDQFLAVLSHELRTPINAILGFGSILDDEVAGPITPEQRRYTRHILRSSEQLLALIDDLLDLSRVTTGRLTLAPGYVSLHAVAALAIDALSPLADTTGHRLINQVPTDLPNVCADARRIEQVLLNLLTNALKYTPGGDITVRASATADTVRCEVVDAGPGIASAAQAELFKPFTQIGEGNTRAAKGLGLGLSIVKALVEAHGGEVGLDSDRDRGSTFWFSLPLESVRCKER